MVEIHSAADHHSDTDTDEHDVEHLLAEEGEEPSEHLQRLRSLRAFSLDNVRGGHLLAQAGVHIVPATLEEDEEDALEPFTPPPASLAASFSHRALRSEDEEVARLPPLTMCRICLDDLPGTTPTRRAVVHLRCDCKVCPTTLHACSTTSLGGCEAQRATPSTRVHLTRLRRVSLGCAQGDLSGAHLSCAKRWVLAKGNAICEICNVEMQVREVLTVGLRLGVRVGESIDLFGTRRH